MNITEYINFSSEKEISPYNINSADILVLTALSYIDFSMVAQKFNKKTKLYDAIDQVFAFEINPESKEFLLELRKSKRFAYLDLMAYRNDYDNLNNPTQFSVITIQITGSLYFISYSGTDGTIVGWKEDFQFSYLTQTPAQNKAVEYLKEAAKKLNGHFIISGHSKGGNLAAYSAIFSDSSVRKRINSVFLNDAPGFNENIDILNQEGYKDLLTKIHCIIPQDSIFGQLLQVFPDVHYNVIYSKSDNLLYQHDIFKWQVEESGEIEFTIENVITQRGMKKLNKIVKHLSMEQRKRLTDFIFDALETKNIRHVDDLKVFIPTEYHLFDSAKKSLNSKAVIKKLE